MEWRVFAPISHSDFVVCWRVEPKRRLIYDISETATAMKKIHVDIGKGEGRM